MKKEVTMKLYVIVNTEEFNIEFFGNEFDLIKFASGFSDEKTYCNADEVAEDFNTENSYLRCYKYETDTLSFLVNNFTANELRAAENARVKMLKHSFGL